jgi:predicted TIM-barrel fold metal-dependent hydrolase
MKQESSLRARLLAELASLRTVDCHSHTDLRRTYYASGGYSLFTLTSYVERDLAATAGGPPYGDATTDAERWARLKPLLAKVRNVSYWRHNLVVYRALFGLKDADLDDTNWRQVNDAIRERSRDPAWYDHVTRDVCRLETQVRNVPWFEDWEPEYFTAVLRMEGALQLHDKSIRGFLEQRLNRSIANLADAKAALERLTEQYVAKGAVGLKLAHAYGRTLHSLPVPTPHATAVFARALTGAILTAAEIKDLQDHIIFHLAELCRAKKLVFQIHTGVQGNWGNVPDSDPLLLIPLLKAFPEVRFDLFHAGYPYSRMLGMLGKHYPNVWLNMAWMYVISMAASRQVLSEWLDLVPGYRILGFGSDVRSPEMVCGHLEMARACVADVLAEKVQRDFLSEEEAFCLARKLFRDNAIEFYGLDGAEAK